MSTSNDPLHSESQPAPYEEQADRIVRRPLSEAEAREKAEIEQRIQDCRMMRFKSTVSIGRDLQRMRDRVLYAPYDDFATYCQVTWDYGPRYVNQLIQAAQVVDNLPKEWEDVLLEQAQVQVLVVSTPLRSQRIKILEVARERAKDQKGKLKGKITVNVLSEAAEQVAILDAPLPFLEDPSLVIPPAGTSMGDAMRSVQETLAKQAAIDSANPRHWNGRP